VGWRSLFIVPLLAAAACGGGSSTSSGGRPHTPAIPAAVAASLATRADAVAADLTAGRGCAARDEAARLRVAVDTADQAGRIPSRLQAQLTDAVASLSARIVCTPPAPTPAPKPHPKPAPKPPHHDDHHHHHEKKHDMPGGGE
jgi:hypothetical protein